MLSHPNSSGFQTKPLTDAAISRLKAKFRSLREVMDRDGVSLQIGPAGLQIEGENAHCWWPIIDSDLELMERELKGLPLDEPSTDIMSVASIRLLMETYGVEDSWTSKQLNDANIGTEYLIEGCLAADQHCVIAGPSKSMKTSISIDLALSLAHPTQFLGHFWVPRRQNVLFLSAESGQGTIQETARRVASSKGFSLDGVNGVFWNFWVPRARNAEQLQILDYQLKQSKASVLIADPTYLMLDGESQANLSSNGEQIQAIVDCCKKNGVTAILVDHTKRGSENAKNRKPLQLEDVTGAGKAENFRQWMLIGRRKNYDPNHPIHELWLTVGGSAGHSGQYQLNIDEERTPEGHRTWAVEIHRGASKSSVKKAGAIPDRTVNSDNLNYTSTEDLFL